MKWGKAFILGVGAGIVMSWILALARLLNVHYSPGNTFGTLVGLSPGGLAWIVGFVIHLIISGTVAWFYALGFEFVSRRAGVMYGVIYSLVHIAIAGVVIGIIPDYHPLIPEILPEPGRYLTTFGTAGVATMIVSHVVYGMTVGGLYGAVHHHRI